MKMALKIFVLLFVFVLTCFGFANAQDNDTIDTWDNQMYISNKVAWSKENWRYTGEFQIRTYNNTRELQQYFIEGVASYMPSKHWEVVPDLRITVYPKRFEFRLGMGTIYKQYWGDSYKNQLAHQMKYQFDIEDGGVYKHGFRYILFHNVVLNEKFIISSAAGGLYRWSERFNRLQFARVMTGIAYSFDKKHIVSFSYFIGAENQGDYWSYIGGPIVQLVIRFDDDFKYVPAKYISF